MNSFWYNKSNIIPNNLDTKDVQIFDNINSDLNLTATAIKDKEKYNKKYIIDIFTSIKFLIFDVHVPYAYRLTGTSSFLAAKKIFFYLIKN